MLVFFKTKLSGASGNKPGLNLPPTKRSGKPSLFISAART